MNGNFISPFFPFLSGPVLTVPDKWVGDQTCAEIGLLKFVSQLTAFTEVCYLIVLFLLP